MTAPSRLLPLLVALGLPACVILGDGGTDDGGTGVAGDDGGGGGQAVADCQDDCDNHLFFDCIDADRHAECRAQCETASESDIATFGSCCQSSLPKCDQATDCVDNFLDTAAGDSSGGGEGGGQAGDTGGDDPLAPCVAACEEVLGAGCGLENPFGSCEEACASLTADERDVLVMCVDGRDGCTFPDGCMIDFGEGPGSGG